MNRSLSSRGMGGRRAAITVLMEAVAIIAAVLSAAPVLLSVLTGLKDQADVAANPIGLPTIWHWSNYTRAWVVGHFGRYFANSVYVAVPAVLAVLALSILAAYAFALIPFLGSNFLFYLFLSGMTIPLYVLIIPLFYDLLHMRMLNTLWALIFPQIAAGLPFGILLLRGFIRDLPRDTLDAGRIDGCLDWGLLRYIVAPLTGPALLALLVFNFMWIWNQFLLPIVFIQNDSARTLPVGLNYFQGRFVTDLPLLMAGATITFIPVVVVYVIFQRHFIRGITAGAIK